MSLQRPTMPPTVSATAGIQTSESIAEVPINNVVLWKDNPRKNDAAVPKLADVIKTRGQVTPVVVWRKNMVAYKGNTTIKALKLLGYKTVKVLYADFPSETAAIAYGIADNKSSEWSEWDDEILKRFQQAESVDLTTAGFTLKNVQMLTGYDDLNVSESGGFFSVYPQSEVIEEGLKLFRKNGFPFPSVTKFEAMQIINTLASMPKDSLRTSPLGGNVADTYNPHRFSVNVRGSSWSATQSFAQDRHLRHAIEFATKGGAILRYQLFGALTIVYSTQIPANFRPAFARMMYDGLAPRGGRVLDPSAGYGGRLVGFISSQCQEYVGVDPCHETMVGNGRLAADLAFRKHVRLIEKPFEDVSDAELMKGKPFDFAFTSPPYFTKEIYSKENTQSCNRYPEYTAWRDKFLHVLIRRCYNVLKKGSHFVLNIENVRIKGELVPLVDDAKAYAEKCGFHFHAKEYYPIGNRPSSQRNEDGEHVYKSIHSGLETVLIFKKP